LAIILADLAKELLHLSGGLVHINDSARLLAHAAPDMDTPPRDENALARPRAKMPISHVKLKLLLDDIDPFILIAMKMFGPARIAVELEHTHRLIRVLCRHLAIKRFPLRPPQPDALTKSIVPGANAEANKHFLG